MVEAEAEAEEEEEAETEAQMELDLWAPKILLFEEETTSDMTLSLDTVQLAVSLFDNLQSPDKISVNQDDILHVYLVTSI